MKDERESNLVVRRQLRRFAELIQRQDAEGLAADVDAMLIPRTLSVCAAIQQFFAHYVAALERRQVSP